MKTFILLGAVLLATPHPASAELTYPYRRPPGVPPGEKGSPKPEKPPKETKDAKPCDCKDK